MKGYVLKRFYVDLNVAELSDDQRDNLIAGIAKVAQTSQFIQANASMVASAGALVTKGATFKTSRATAAASRKVADADESTVNTNRAAVDAELMSFAGMVQSNAKSDDDIKSAALTPRGPKPPKPPFAPPDSIDVIFPSKEKGKFKTSPHGVGKARICWVVQWSPDPVGPNTWVEVHGPGKTRTFKGASGTSIWVRYAMVRDDELSAWSTPVLVTFP